MTQSHPRSFSKRVLTPLLVLAVAASVQGACSDTIHNNTYNNYGAGEAGSVGQAGGDGSGGTDGTGGTGGYPGAPVANTTVAKHNVDLFGKVGHRFWFAVSDEQLAQLNEPYGSVGGPIFDGPVWGGAIDGDLYSPGGVSANYVDHLWLTTAGKNGRTADYGKVQVKLVGQSTGRPWNKRSIPNFNIDSNEFVKGQRIGGFEHLRLGNAQVGSIFREHITLELYDKLGYPAPLSTYAWVTSNVWGPDIFIPYVLVERYKRSFCEREQALLGGGCVNMWEFVGDFARNYDQPIPLRLPGGIPSVFDDPSSCQINECDNERVKELEELLYETPEGPGFKEATKDYVDWPSFHRFQCLSWVLATGDDALHNQNNVVLVERSDGKFQYLPYSVDISLGQDWYPVVPLPGHNVLARGCQLDESCWDDLIAECEDVIERFTALDPIGLLADVHATLKKEGMLRPGDDARYSLLKGWFESRLEELPRELEDYREPPAVCDFGQVDCGGYCDYPEYCGNCNPIDHGGGPVPPNNGLGGAGSGGGTGGGQCEPIFGYPVGK